LGLGKDRTNARLCDGFTTLQYDDDTKKMMSVVGNRLMASPTARNGGLRWAKNHLMTRTAARNSTTAAAGAAATPSAPPSSSLLSGFRNRNFVMGIGSGLLLAGLHSATGSANDFYDYRFKSPKDADDLASFYGGEELMELFCIFPLVGQIMMRSATFDDTGGIKTQGFPGTMEVKMVFSDDVNDETGETDWCKYIAFILSYTSSSNYL
jgi:hypothetical protein